MKDKKEVSSPEKFNVIFHDFEGEEVGKLIVYPNKPVEFEGDLDKSAEMFFEHLKERIDRYIFME